MTEQEFLSPRQFGVRFFDKRLNTVQKDRKGRRIAAFAVGLAVPPMVDGEYVIPGCGQRRRL